MLRTTHCVPTDTQIKVRQGASVRWRGIRGCVGEAYAMRVRRFDASSVTASEEPALASKISSTSSECISAADFLVNSALIVPSSAASCSSSVCEVGRGERRCCAG